MEEMKNKYWIERQGQGFEACRLIFDSLSRSIAPF